MSRTLSNYRFFHSGPTYLSFENVSGWHGSRTGADDLWVLPKPVLEVFASVVSFPLFWALEASLVGWAAGLCWVLAFFVSLPLGGLVAYRYLAGTGRLATGVPCLACLSTWAGCWSVYRGFFIDTTLPL
jgi:hypothetical protein